VILRASLDAQARLGRFGCSLGISRSGAFATIDRAAFRHERAGLRFGRLPRVRSTSRAKRFSP
jgi:hypothetical protein